jgi:hypothetical protein
MLARSLARECGADVEFGERTLAFLDKAVARGTVEEDYSLLHRDSRRSRRQNPKRPAANRNGLALPRALV